MRIASGCLPVLFACGCERLSEGDIATALAHPRSTIGRRLTMLAVPPAAPVAKRITKRRANASGAILILEYHKLDAKNTLLDRSPAKFRKDLERLYALGYRPVTVSAWLNGKMKLPPGASPVIITFDDSHESQFRLTKEGSVAPNTFVGTWLAFAQKHPDFPLHATFFVLPPHPFGQVDLSRKKVKMLLDWGSEIGCHTYHHPDLAKCTDARVKEEIATSLDWLEHEFGVTDVPLAFPYGIKPKNMSILRGFQYEGREYHVSCALLAAGEPAKGLNSKQFDPWVIHRVVACDRPGGSSEWLQIMKKSPRFAPYVAP